MHMCDPEAGWRSPKVLSRGFCPFTVKHSPLGEACVKGLYVTMQYRLESGCSLSGVTSPSECGSPTDESGRIITLYLVVN